MKKFEFRLKTVGFIITLLLGVTNISAIGQTTELATEAIVFDHPKMFLNSSEITKIKAKVAANQAPWKTAYDTFMNQARTICNAANPLDPASACRTPVYSVTFQNIPPLPYTIHDYYTDVPYRNWCKKVQINGVCTAVTNCNYSPCGTDFCDKQTNPCAERGDYTAAINMAKAVKTLGLAYAFTSELRYAKKAIELIYKWAINPDTLMNPRFTGPDGEGQIELSITMPGLFYGADLIWAYPDWIFAGVDVKAKFKYWTNRFITDAYKYGGNCYDSTTICNNWENWRLVFLSSASVIVEDSVVLTDAFSKWKLLIDSQMASDGSLVKEKGRSLGYSTYAVNAMSQTAEIARHYGINLYSYKLSAIDNRGLELALDFLAPYIKTPASWNYSSNTYSGANSAIYEMAYSFKQKGPYLDVITKWTRPMDESRIMGPVTLTHAYGAYPFFSSSPSVVATPSFSPGGGTYTSTQNVSISTSTTGATIRYTLDGTTPTASSTAYSAPIVVSSTKTINAKAFKTGMTDSATASAAYTINIPPSVVSTPSFSPAGGTYTSTQNVSISTSTTGATIRYTLNGTAPTASSTAYSAPIVVSSTKTINAKAFKSGMTDSATASAAYTISTSLVNLIANPGFESGTTSWLFYTGGTGSFTTGTPAYAGSKGAKVTITTANTNIQLYQTDKTIEPNKTYKLTFTAYSNTGRDLVVHLLKGVSPYTNYGLSYTANLGTTWQTFTTQFTSSGITSTVNDGRFRFWLSGAAANDIFYIDEVKLEKIN